MPLGDEFRSGPNQDINDPFTLIQLAYEYQRVSNNLGAFKILSETQSIEVFNPPPLTDIIIPLYLENGNIEEFFGDTIIKVSDTLFIYNSGIWEETTILTYIDLAESFRDYWNLFNTTMDELENYVYTATSGIDPQIPIGTGLNIFNGYTETGQLGGTEYRQTDQIFSPNEGVDEPIWSGFGPTNYNEITYPQLLTALSDVDVQLFSITSDPFETKYWYRKDEIPGVSFPYTSDVSLRMGRGFGDALDSLPVITIYNFGDDTVNIALSATASVSASSPAGDVSAIGNAGIRVGGVLVQEQVFNFTITNGGSDSDSAIASYNFDLNPNESETVAVRAFARALLNIGESSTSTLSTTVNINGFGISHSVSN